MSILERLIFYSVIEIINGRLLIDKDHWHQVKLSETDSNKLIIEIIQLFNLKAYRYSDSSVGDHPAIKGSTKRVTAITLTFLDITNLDEDIFAMTEVITKPARTTGTKPVSQRYKKRNQFRLRPTKRREHILVRLFDRLGLNKPRPRDVWKSLGGLSEVLVLANPSEIKKNPKKRNLDDIKPINLTNEQIQNRYKESESKRQKSIGNIVSFDTHYKAG